MPGPSGSLVIGTYRTDELNRRHPLRPWLAEMERLPRVARIELTRFGRSELEAQMAAILGHVPAAALIETVARRTEGNPFFVEELLASGADEPGRGLPQTLRDVLLTRVTALPDEAQRLLGVALGRRSRRRFGPARHGLGGRGGRAGGSRSGIRWPPRSS